MRTPGMLVCPCKDKFHVHGFIQRTDSVCIRGRPLERGGQRKEE
jgi:hypothetical protein